jgi:hypothetical protein
MPNIAFMKSFPLVTILIALLIVQPVCAQEIEIIPLQPPAATPPSPNPGALARGTEVHLVLLDSISSATAKKGQTVHFAVAQGIQEGEVVLIPRGTPAEGIVTQVRKGIPGKHDGTLQLEPRQILLNDGSRLKLSHGRPGEDDCGDMGPCWALATFAVVLSPVLIATFVVASPWLIHDKIKNDKKFPRTKPQIAGKDEVLLPCGLNYAFTSSPLGSASDAATPHPVADAATLEQLANCPAH